MKRSFVLCPYVSELCYDTDYQFNTIEEAYSYYEDTEISEYAILDSYSLEYISSIQFDR